MDIVLLDSSFEKNCIGKNIKYLLEELKITQEQLSMLTGLSCASIISYEKGRRMPSIANLYKLSDVLGTNIVALTVQSDVNVPRPVRTASSSCPDEMTTKATVSATDYITFEFSSKLRKDITAEELSALFDEAKARVWGFLQPVKG